MIGGGTEQSQWAMFFPSERVLKLKIVWHDAFFFLEKENSTLTLLYLCNCGKRKC